MEAEFLAVPLVGGAHPLVGGRCPPFGWWAVPTLREFVGSAVRTKTLHKHPLEFRNPREMIVIVLRGEHTEVEDAHLDLCARMKRCHRPLLGTQ